MRRIGLTILLALLATVASAQAPHQHGHGVATITFEGNRLAVELVMPGADIVGFERPPQTPAEEAALAGATAALRNPVGILELPTTARCTIAEAEVTVEGYERPAAGAAAAAHTEFEAIYVFNCADAGGIRFIEFPLFDKFQNAQEIEVTVLTGRSPTAYEVTRANPRLDRGNFLLRWLTGR